jgi:hypothetical protein
MNNRIEELANGCFDYIEGTLDGDIVEFDYKKFAERIIKECAQVGEETGGDYKVRAAILEHFGVE